MAGRETLTDTRPQRTDSPEPVSHKVIGYFYLNRHWGYLKICIICVAYASIDKRPTRKTPGGQSIIALITHMSFLDSNQQECVLATENYNPCEFVQNSDLDICNENDMPFRYSPWYGLNDEDSLSTN